MQHTPGPWHMGAGNGVGHIFAPSGRMRLEQGGTTLYAVCRIADGWDEAEDEANGRLIAAAPDLLAACKAVVGYLADNRGREQMEAAIAKAEGKPCDPPSK